MSGIARLKTAAFVFAAALIALSAQTVAVAQTCQATWEDLHPGAAYGLGAAWDTVRSRLVVFGGDASVGISDKTWEWDGARWIRRDPPHSPPPRYMHAMTYDALHGVTVVFGGFDGGSTRADTWIYDGTDWTQMLPATNPRPRGGRG